MFRDCEKESKKKYFSNTIPPLRLIPIKKEETSTPPTVIKKCVVKVKNILDLTNDGSQDLSAVPDIQIPAQSGSTTSTPKEDISFASWIAGKRAETASGKKSEVASENGSQTPSVSRTEGSSDPSTTLDVSGSGLGASGSGLGASGRGAGASGSRRDGAFDITTDINQFLDDTGFLETSAGRRARLTQERIAKEQELRENEREIARIQDQTIIARIQKTQNNLARLEHQYGLSPNNQVITSLAGTKPKLNREDRLNFIRYKTQVFFCFFIFLFFIIDTMLGHFLVI